jgi:hypothetical protein
MNYKLITEWIVFAGVAVWLIYDVVIFAMGRPDSTISSVIWAVSLKHPFLPFMVGFAMGHLFAY